jgi:hypothetical protein
MKRKKTGGRKPGSTNKVTDSIRALLNRLLPEKELAKQWAHHLKHSDPQIRYKSFELANHYMFGKPPLPIIGAEDQPPVMINISAIPQKKPRAE